jgi:hypothetical protein
MTAQAQPGFIEESIPRIARQPILTADEKGLRAARLSEPVFQFDGAVGFFVAVLHNDRSVQR